MSNVASSVVLPIAKPRRTLRFSLPTLMLLTTALCIWLGLVALRARRQEVSVKTLEAAGAGIGYDWWKPTSATPTPEPSGPKWLRKIVGDHFFNTVVSVHLWSNQFHHPQLRFVDVGPSLVSLPNLDQLSLQLEMDENDFAMLVENASPRELGCGTMTIGDREAVQLARMSSIRILRLNETIISAQGIAELQRLPYLEFFSLCCRNLEYEANGAPKRVDTYYIGDDATTAITKFPALKKLSLTFTSISDEGIAELCKLEGLEMLTVSGRKITNACLDDIVKLKHLTWLGLPATSVSDEGLKKLKELPRLKGVYIGREVTNEGLAVLAELEQLERIDLGGDEIDDRGLVYLEGMKNLKSLDLRSTKVKSNSEAVTRLRKALPNCDVHTFYPSWKYR